MGSKYVPKYDKKKKEPVLKARNCLRCAKTFKPKSRFNFICKTCAKSNETDDLYSILV